MPSPPGHVGYYGNNKNCTDIRDTTSCFPSCPETSPNLGKNQSILFFCHILFELRTINSMYMNKTVRNKADLQNKQTEYILIYMHTKHVTGNT